jgi:hypothetical protein
MYTSDETDPFHKLIKYIYEAFTESFQTLFESNASIKQTSAGS